MPILRRGGRPAGRGGDVTHAEVAASFDFGVVVCNELWDDEAYGLWCHHVERVARDTAPDRLAGHDARAGEARDPSRPLRRRRQPLRRGRRGHPGDRRLRPVLRAHQGRPQRLARPRGRDPACRRQAGRGRHRHRLRRRGRRRQARPRNARARHEPLRRRPRRSPDRWPTDIRRALPAWRYLSPSRRRCAVARGCSPNAGPGGSTGGPVQRDPVGTEVPAPGPTPWSPPTARPTRSTARRSRSSHAPRSWPTSPTPTWSTASGYDARAGARRPDQLRRPTMLLEMGADAFAAGPTASWRRPANGARAALSRPNDLTPQEARSRPRRHRSDEPEIAAKLFISANTMTPPAQGLPEARHHQGRRQHATRVSPPRPLDPPPPVPSLPLEVGGVEVEGEPELAGPPAGGWGGVGGGGGGDPALRRKALP